MQNSAPKGKGKPVMRKDTAPPRLAGEMLSVLSYIMTVENVDSVLQKIAETVAELFSMKSLVIGVRDEKELIFRVRATHGYDAERSKKIKKFTYSIERLNLDIDDKNSIAEDVFMIRPEPGEIIKGEEAFYQNMNRIGEPRTDPAKWHELDYIRFVFRNREGIPIGFMEINDSLSPTIPDAATIEAMQIFSQLAAVAIENATMFQTQVEMVKRSKFLSDVVAHDINNFNQAITSYLQLALADRPAKEKTASYLERAAAAAWGISEMIQRANMLIKIEEEGAENLGPMDLGQVLRESIEEVKRSSDSRNVKVDLKLGNRRYFVLGNELANDIFTNLIGNAIDYDPHDQVVVDVTIGEFTVEPMKYWCVSIADNGIGIPDSKKNIVFGRFGGDEAGAPAGGLGLSIVRAIVEAYHGMVWVEDRVPGEASKGSIFRVALPISAAK
jgi:signal transduction histidine kinase